MRSRQLALLCVSLVVAASLWVWTACRRNSPPPTVVRDLNRTEREELERTWGPELSPSKGSSWFLWWEAEDAVSTNFQGNPFAPSSPSEASALSGGRWMGTSGAKETPFLEYSVELPEAGRYWLYARKFWHHGPFRWRFGDAPWRDAKHFELLDREPLRTHVEANWVSLGEVVLSGGAQTFRVELLDAEAPAAFDAFVLSRDELVPRGKLKPDEPSAAPPAGWVTFAPGTDDFSESVLDLRERNQARAGDEGFVRAAGSQLVFERSRRVVRFWGVNAGGDLLELPKERQERYARRLAKLGVNLLRLHAPFFRDDDVRKLDERKLSSVHRLVALLRDQGIYLELSTYFPLWWHPKPNEGFAGYEGQAAFSLAFFSPKFREIQREWLRALLSRPNPHTGLPLSQDPTLALVELVNEDSTLFWTFEPYKTLPEAQTIELERAFGTWLARKYGDLREAFSAWGGRLQRGDDSASGRAGFLSLYDVSHERDLRSRDTAEFLARLMRDYYQAMHTFLKHELGVQALSICSNWITADPRVLGPLDDWANAICDVMDRHAYVSGPHEGEAVGYAVRAGQKYDDASVLRVGRGKPASLPFIEPRINDKPTVVSELGWSWPNRFRGEGPLLAAAYGRLHGLDGVMFFASSKAGWADALDKFEIAEPATMGQFPAAALIFRGGLVREGSPVATVARSEKSLFELKGVPIDNVPALDTLQAGHVTRVAQQLGVTGDNDPLMFLVGPVAIELGAAVDRFEASDIERWLDRSHGVARSQTEELSWDYINGLVQVRAPEVEATFGFVGEKRSIDLPSLRFSPLLDYATLALVALDGRPVAESQRLLLQVFSEATNSGWSASGTGTRKIASAGGAPILTRSISGVVEWLGKTDVGVRVTALDANGHPVRRSASATRRIPLLPGVFHYLLEP